MFSKKTAKAPLRHRISRRELWRLCGSITGLVIVCAVVAGCNRDPRDSFDRQITALISKQRLQEQLSEFTAAPHPAGSEANHKVGDAILRRLQSSGLKITTAEYDVALHTPETSSLTLVSPINKTFDLHEKELAEDSFTAVADGDIPYFAYVPDFDVTAEVIYANYGAREDYDVLKKAGIKVEGKIALVRAQGICRGMKGIIAEEEHLAGLLLYPELKDMGFVYPAYPEGRHLNPWTIQRGSMLRYFQYPGEPRDKQPSTLPTIPALPVSENIASAILNLMQGNRAPSDWQGAMTTRYILAMQSPVLRMQFRGKVEKKKIRNILATIPGTHADEPSVMIGSHYDAWVYGAADPSSATSVVLETANVFAEMLHKGWKPRRTISFAFWDAEEFGMIGSTRWVEQNPQSKLAVYLSVDTAVQGKDFVSYIQPGIRGPLDEALKRVNDPEIGKKIFDIRGTFNLPGFTGDVAPFTSLAGVPTAEITFGRLYPMYHSVYDDYAWFTKFTDPEMKYSATLTHILILFASTWSDTPILPYRFREIADYATNSLPDTKVIRNELHDFEHAAEAIDALRANRYSDGDVKRINNRLYDAFRAFYDPALPYSSRNLLIGPAKQTGCNAEPFPDQTRLPAAFRKSTKQLIAAQNAE